MSTPLPASTAGMPDIAGRPHTQPQGKLDWVGMSDIHQPILVRDGDTTRQVQARVQVYVDLNDPHAKGIHMSRLYLLLDEHARTRPLSVSGLKLLLGSLHSSHLDLSDKAFIQFEFDYEIRQSALISENSGWASYPVTIKGTLENGAVELQVGVEILYSSTCPCSAALARQLIQKAFADKFRRGEDLTFDAVNSFLGAEDGIVATPHSQRSIARVLTRLDPAADELPIRALIETLEEAIGTPVQSAVKREDEQEFALRNGQNLMFCEDAGRKLQRALSDDRRFEDFWIRVEHHESLHAHNAVSITTAGVENGYLPIP